MNMFMHNIACGYHNPCRTLPPGVLAAPCSHPGVLASPYFLMSHPLVPLALQGPLVLWSKWAPPCWWIGPRLRVVAQLSRVRKTPGISPIFYLLCFRLCSCLFFHRVCVPNGSLFCSHSCLCCPSSCLCCHGVTCSVCPCPSFFCSQVLIDV